MSSRPLTCTTTGCYQALVASGIPVDSLGKSRSDGQELRYSRSDVDRFRKLTDEADVVLTLKEQPLALVNQARVETPVISCLHRSDPHNQGDGLRQLTTAIDAGRVRHCTVPAHSARDAYEAAGVPPELLHVIPNGIDLERFIRCPERRSRVRTELGIPADVPVVLLAARHDDMKDVPLFLASAKLYLEREPEAHVVMSGNGMTDGNGVLGVEIKEAFHAAESLVRRLHLVGARPDIEDFFAATDVVALTSSHGEAQPLCLLEGMACGAVPVATDVGDTRRVVDRFGIITSNDADEIAGSWRIAHASRDELRVPQDHLTRFDRHTMITQYEQLLASVT